MEVFDYCKKKLRSSQAEKYELYFEKSSNLGIEVKEGKLDHLTRSSDHGLAIRVLKNNQAGFAYTFDLSHEALDQTIHTALAVADLMPKDPLNDLISFNSSHYLDFDSHDAKGIEVSFEKKLELTQKMEERTLQHNSKVKNVRKAGYDETNSEIFMMDSNAEIISYKQTAFSFQIYCVAEQGSDAETGYDVQISSFLDQINTDEISTEAAKTAVAQLGGKPAPTMQCPAVFKNSVVAELIGFLSASFSAENIDKNFSLLVGKLGQNLFSKKLTLVDDPLLAGAVGSAPFDGEGSPSMTKNLIESGMVANFLYDSYYARKMKVKNTANSRRGGLTTPPSIGTSNLYLKKGKKSFTELVSEISKGILITDLMGLHTANPVTGEFSVGASGMLIENGVVTSPVKGFAIAGNLVDLLKMVDEVGSDLRFWGSVGSPSILVSKLSVSGS